MHSGHTGTWKRRHYSKAGVRVRAGTNLNIHLVRTGASVILILEVVGTEYFTASVALHRKEIQLSAGFLTALFTKMGQLHGAKL